MIKGDITLQYLLRPIQAHLDHPMVTDIVINKPQQVGIRRAGIWEWEDVPSFDFDTLDAMTILIGQRVGRDFDEGRPYVNSTLPGGQRFQGVRPPGTKAGRILWAIRRPPTNARSLDDDDFEDLTSEVNAPVRRAQRAKGSVAEHYRNGDWRECFRSARMVGLSIAFVGATGGGKTDMTRRLAQVYRRGTRLVTIETDDEFGEVGPDNKAPLFYDDTQVSSDEAVRIALRLIPNEIALQEIRGAEAYSLLRAMTSGHNGITTWHGEEGRELDALCMMARQHPAGREMTEERLMDMAHKAFDLVAYCQRDENRFRITSVRLLAAEMEAA
jgi:type IV secretion system protein VirB11